MSIKEFFCKLDAGILDELSIGFQTAVERHRDSPRPRKSFRILDRHLIANGVRTNGREPFNQVEGSAVKVPSPVEPILAVEARHVDDQCIAFPAADRMTHVCIVRGPLGLIQMDRASRVGKRECHLNFVRALDDLKWIRHIHCPWNARQITLQLRIAINPVCSVLLLYRSRLGFVRNFPVTLHHAERSRHTRRSTEREHGRCRHAGEFIFRINTGLCHGPGACFVSLQVPMRLIVGLPNTAEVRLAVGRAGGPHRTLRRRARHCCSDSYPQSSRDDDDHNH